MPHKQKNKFYEHELHESREYLVCVCRVSEKNSVFSCFSSWLALSLILLWRLLIGCGSERMEQREQSMLCRATTDENEVK